MSFKITAVAGAVLAGWMTDCAAWSASAGESAAPAYYGACREWKTGEVKPAGCLAEFLRRQADGLTGHRERLGYPFDGSLWEGRMPEIYFTEGVYEGSDQKKEGTAEDFWASGSWWPFEQSAYQLDGMVRTAALLGDGRLMADAARSFEWVLAHPAPDGDLFTPLSNSGTQWPLVVMFRALWAWGEATGREADVVRAFARHFAAHAADRAAWGDRSMLSAEGMCKIYERTGDAALLADAVAAYRGTRYHREFGRERRIHDHGVSFSESLKIPALLYLHTGDAALLDEGRKAMEDVFAVNAQADGQVSANEFLSGRDPRQGHETCISADMTWALGSYLLAERNVRAADRMEKIVYNALPGSCTKDFRRHQYLSSVNQAFCTPFSQSAHFNFAEAAWRQYRASHFPQCCTGNISRAMPAYVARLWLKDAASGAPVKMVYGPSKLEGEYKGVRYVLEELDGGYPFGDRATFVYHGGEIEMPLYYRVPSWCDRADAGKVLVEKRVWKDGDSFTVELPSKVVLRSDRNWHWLERGPLTFAYAVPGEAEEERPGDPFTALRIVPDGPWNYAFDTNFLAKADLEVEFRKSAYPFEFPSAVLKVPVCEIEEWRVPDENRFMPDPPLFAHPTGMRKVIELVPYATTLGRVTCFPDVTPRRELPVVAAYSSGEAYPYDETKPIEEQAFEPEGWDDSRFRNLYKVPQRTPGMFFDLRDLYGDGRGRLAYLMFRFWSDEAGEATYALGGASRLQAFIDGREVYRGLPWTEGEMMAPEWFRHEVKKGYNYLLVKCALPKGAPGQFRREWGAKLTVFMEGRNGREDPSAKGGGAMRLAGRWADALASLEVERTGNAALDGNIVCPACAAFHGRACEAVWPLVWLWARTGDARRLDAAKRLVSWARRNCERPDGAYLNDPNTGWRGTTIFTQTAIGKTLLRFGDRLDEATRREWRGIFDRQTKWLHKWMDDPALVVNVNYRAGFALAMEIAYALDGDEAHRISGDREAARVLGCIGGDGLVSGEAKPLESVSPRGNRGVDIGYNMEETLPAMFEWAEMRGDAAAYGRLVESGAAHLAFALPDGGIDDSFGSRAYKWTYWGSRTSDGALPLYAALAKAGVPGAALAAERTLALYRRCTDDETGLLAGGLDYGAAEEPACVHHTFCHLKTLPGFIEWREGASAAAMDKSPAPRLKMFSTVETAVANVGPWRATASANDVYFVDDNGKSTGGGSLTLLHLRDWGPVFAASMAKWSLVERLNMQEQLHDDVTRCFTPRIETPDGRFMSVFDDRCAFGAEELPDGPVRFFAKGTLTDSGDAPLGEGGAFSLEWTVSESGVRAVATSASPAVFVLPVISRSGELDGICGGSARFSRGGRTLELKSNRSFNRVSTQRADSLAFSPQTGFLAAYLTLPVAPGERTELEITAH